MPELAKIATTTILTPEQIIERTSAIHDSLIKTSRYVRSGDFQAIHPRDLEQLFVAYDSTFFSGVITQQLGTTPLRFRLSKRLTSAAGTTTRRRSSKHFGSAVLNYEITISTTLLFQTFRDVNRQVTASGVECRNRLEALQRVFEHELIHLIEFLAWNDSACTAQRFQQISWRFFGHREHTHQLITQRERAMTKFGLRVGDRVTFRLDGRHYEGIINRVTRRATVLVEDAEGVRYSNGKRYSKFYVPLDHLQAITARRA